MSLNQLTYMNEVLMAVEAIGGDIVYQAINTVPFVTLITCAIYVQRAALFMVISVRN